MPPDKFDSAPPPPPSSRSPSEQPVACVPSSLPEVPTLGTVPSPPRSMSAPHQARLGDGPSSMLSPQIARLEHELSMVRKHLRAQRAETRIEQQNNEQLRAELASLRRAVDDPDSPKPALDARAEGLLSEHAEQIRKLEASHANELAEVEAQCAREIARLEDKQAKRLGALRNTLRTAEELTLAKTDRIRRLEARLAKLQVGDVVRTRRTKTATGADDLTALRGVGPAFARALRHEGVTTFIQIASWSAEDIDRIGPKIGTTAGRIRKDEWVSEARKLAGR